MSSHRGCAHPDGGRFAAGVCVFFPQTSAAHAPNSSIAGGLTLETHARSLRVPPGAAKTRMPGLPMRGSAASRHRPRRKNAHTASARSPSAKAAQGASGSHPLSHPGNRNPRTANPYMECCAPEGPAKDRRPTGMRRVEQKASRTAEWTCLARAASWYETSPCYKSNDFIAPRIIPGKVAPIVGGWPVQAARAGRRTRQSGCV